MASAGRQTLLLLLFGAVVAAGFLLPRPADLPSHADAPWIRIAAPDGSPVAGARVRFHAWGLNLFRGPALVGEAITGRDGRVRLPAEWAVATVEALDFAGGIFPLPRAGEVLMLREGEAVRGLVLDLHGRPVPGARVFSPPRRPAVREADCDAAGRFLLPPVVRNAVLRAEAPGYAPLEVSLSLYPDEDRTVVFWLVPGRTVAGRVVDSAGQPVADAGVLLDQEVGSVAVTDAGGRFRFDGVLCDWEVLLTPLVPGLVGRRVTAVAGQGDVLLRLYRPVTVSGEAVDAATGAPVAGAAVGGTTAGPDGRFTLADLHPGEIGVEADAGALSGSVTLHLREGEHRSGVVIPLRPPRWASPEDFRPGYPVRIQGVEAGTDRPAAGFRLRGGRGEETRADGQGRALVLVPPGRHRLRLGGPFERYAESVLDFTAPEEREFRVELVPNRAVTLELAGGWAQPESKFWLRCGSEVVEKRIIGRSQEFLAPADHPFDLYLEARHYLPAGREILSLPPDGRIVFALAEGPVITGRCLGAGGHPLPKVVVEVEEEPLTARTETLGDGVFRIGGLDPGRYRVLLYARNVRTRRFEVDVREDGIADLGDVEMRPPAEIAVRVLDSAGVPVRGALVESALFISATAATDAGGLARLPGRHEEETLRVRGEGFLDAWPEVRAGAGDDRVDAAVRLFRPARLLVRVVDREGRPVEVDLPGGLAARAAGPGEVLVERLPPGPFELTLEDRAERSGTLRTVLLEGEARVETLVLE